MRALRIAFACLFAVLAPIAALATTVTATQTVYITRAGATVTVLAGATFDATDDEIAKLLPLGAITIGSGGTSASNVDFSANPPAVPGGSPLITIPANAARAYVEVQNQSIASAQLVRDDGAGNSVTSIILAPAAAPGGQGAGWSSTTFRGRVRVYAPTGAQIAAYQE